MIAMAHHVLFAVLSERITARQEALSKHHESWDDMQDELSTLLIRYLADTGGAGNGDGEAALTERWPPGDGTRHRPRCTNCAAGSTSSAAGGRARIRTARCGWRPVRCGCSQTMSPRTRLAGPVPTPPARRT